MQVRPFNNEMSIINHCGLPMGDSGWVGEGVGIGRARGAHAPYSSPTYIHVYVYVCMYVCMYVCTYVCMYV